MNIREEQARRFVDAVIQKYGGSAEQPGYAKLRRDMEAQGYDWRSSRFSNYASTAHWRRGFGAEEAIILGRFLDRSAAYLLCIDEESTLDKDEASLLRFYRKADHSGKTAILTTAQHIAGYTPGRTPPTDRPITRQ